MKNNTTATSGCFWFVLTACIWLITGCQTTPSVDVAGQYGTLGNYSAFKPMSGHDKTLYYEKSGVDWSKYRKVIIDPADFAGAGSHYQQMPPRDQHLLATYFEYTMRDNIVRKYDVAKNAGPGVLRLRVAITGSAIADAQFRQILGLASTANRYIWMEGELQDAQTNERLVALVDGQSGQLFSSFSAWDDVTGAFDHWADQLVAALGERLVVAANSSAGKVTSVVDSEIDLDADDVGQDESASSAATQEHSVTVAKTSPVPTSTLPTSTLPTSTLPTSTLPTSTLPTSTNDDNGSQQQVTAMAKTDEQGSLATDIPASNSAKALTHSATTKPAVVAPVTSKPDAFIDDWAEADLEVVGKTTTTKPVLTTSAQKTIQFDPWGGTPGKGGHNWGQGRLRPYILGIITQGDLSDVVAASKKRLIDAGFMLAGDYSPYRDAHIIIATSDSLQRIAAKTSHGGYGTAIRVSVTVVGDKVQVAYTNPLYMLNIYRMDGDITEVAKKLGKALGQMQAFGSEQGIAVDDLRNWHYMFGMPYFDDQVELATASNHAAAVDNVEAALGAGVSGTKKIYRIDIPGGKETLFGVAMQRGDGSDKTVMKTIDNKALRHTAHLPYDILVSGDTVYALNGKFRIALSFPDLAMGEFMAIRNAPDSIAEVLSAVAKGLR